MKVLKRFGVILLCGALFSQIWAAETGIAQDKVFPFYVPSTAESTRLDVPFVPTPQDVVDEMLKTAAVRKHDTLYDLGCGDGRIVVTAAQRYGVKGIGVDLDPERIRESGENARKAGVSDKVKFFRKDLFGIDMHDASVVTLYLLPSVNLKLRSKLLDELRPGARIVSHDFDMGEWKPDVTKTKSSHKIYCWIVPGNVSGTWRWKMPSSQGTRTFVLKLTQNFQRVSGSLAIGDEETPLAIAKADGNVFIAGTSTKVAEYGMIRFRAEIDRHVMKGYFETGDPTAKYDFKAKRDPATRTRVDGEEATPRKPALMTGISPIMEISVTSSTNP